MSLAGYRKKKQSGREKSKYTEMTFLFHDNLPLLTFLYIKWDRFKYVCCYMCRFYT